MDKPKDDYIKFLEKENQELHKEKKKLKAIVDGLFVEGPDPDDALYLKVEHESMDGSFALRLNPHNMVGQTALKYGQVLNDV